MARRPHLLVAGVIGLVACKDLGQYSTAADESYCGKIVAARIVRCGFESSVCMRMTFDGQKAGTAPGTLSTDDGMFVAAPLRVLPELSHDPLLTFTFGEGREKNLLYAATPSDPSRGPTAMAVISLMHSGDAEVRLVRGAGSADACDPTPGPDGGPAVDGPPLFGVFAPLRRQKGACESEPDCRWMTH